MTQIGHFVLASAKLWFTAQTNAVPILGFRPLTDSRPVSNSPSAIKMFHSTSLHRGQTGQRQFVDLTSDIAVEASTDFESSSGERGSVQALRSGMRNHRRGSGGASPSMICGSDGASPSRKSPSQTSSPHTSPFRTTSTHTSPFRPTSCRALATEWSGSVVSLALAFCFILLCSTFAVAQTNHKYQQEDKFRQLDELLPTPNEYRTASGAPGNKYWQQQVDYDIDVRIDDDTQKLFGSERIAYRNNSPDTLTYLWLQLDQNIRAPQSDAHLIRSTEKLDKIEFDYFRSTLVRATFDGSYKITRCVTTDGEKPLKHTVVKTMLRIDLPQPLSHGDTFQFTIDWNYQINDSKQIWGRTGFESFPDSDDRIYEIAQWFPRLCKYSDAVGWQNKQFLGRGEFALEFGNYLVRITMPGKHVVAATGELLNPDEVLSETMLKRLEDAADASDPVFIITPDEAKANESKSSTDSDEKADEETTESNGETDDSTSQSNEKNESPDSGETKTWIFKANQVRDFAFASSRKFIWDAMAQKIGDRTVMAMSYYPNEAEPLWSQYSTRAVAHTLDVYSRFTFDYPYPVAISVNGPVYGMEYPMICFNGPRPESDGTYTKRTKYALISVIIHEVGHNWFPMIINSDERQWTWMDEGLNSFMQYLAEQEWEADYPSRWNQTDIVSYMNSPLQVPIMTNSESILKFGANAYHKPAVALNILRETIMGREQFDFAFKQYSNRWKFKTPQPADFFRSLEDASGIDLDWFWRGWFYSTDHTDIAITNVRHLNVDTADPDIEKAIQKRERDDAPKSITSRRNKSLDRLIDRVESLKDFYNSYDELAVTAEDRKAYKKLLEDLSDEEQAMLKDQHHFYLLDFQNVGGLVMPILLDIVYEDDSTQQVEIPAEIWRHNNQKVTKLWITEKVIKSVSVDSNRETADADLSNNVFPPKIEKSRFKIFKKTKEKNPMQKAAEAEANDSEEDGQESTDD